MVDRIELDFSQITDYLVVGAQPQAEHAKDIAAHNIRLMICMMGEQRPPKTFSEKPLSALWLPSYDTFLTPIGVDKLMLGVESALSVVKEGGRVFVYCHKGRHRSVVMAAAILIAAGHSAKEAIELLRTKRQVADPQTWYIRWQIHRFEKHWLKHQKSLKVK